MRFPNSLYRLLKMIGLVKPMLFEYEKIGYSTTITTEVVEKMFKIARDDSDYVHFSDEFASLRIELSARIVERSTDYDWEGAVDWSTAFVLYLLTRLLKPKNVVETGVSKGVSTFFLLRALELNGEQGVLHSFDVLPDCGILLNPVERSKWSLTIPSSRSDQKTFQNVIQQMGEIDFFVHDSNHSYANQMFEYKTVYPKLSAQAIFASDDVNFSWAFIDFVKEHNLSPFFLVTPKNVFGITKVE